MQVIRPGRLLTHLWNILKCNLCSHDFIFFFKGRKNGKAPAIKDLECAAKEGHKMTHFDFEPSREYVPGDTSIKGEHYGVKNRMYWMASCFGIGTPCSLECEGIFKEYL